eukprot:scaffold26027_cov79-Isochrysis_galbana.AAC.1
MPQGGGGGVGGVASGQPQSTFESPTPKADNPAGGVAAGRSAAKENATGANAPCPHPVLFRGPAHLSGGASGNITVTRFVNSRAVNTCSVAAQAENACGGALVHMDMRGVNNLAVNSGGGAAAAENASAGGGGEVAAAPPHAVYSGQHAVCSGQHAVCSGSHEACSGLHT